ncbi:LacI family DNA-binding transcriptional regulator [Brachybacterium paraconglomeratum]|uniref:LacI family DNA-binding transcriptional regulator n=1 Tax=Brachybacterium paraconglomeratum TaxID=173362 RepID=UPI0031E9D9E4
MAPTMKEVAARADVSTKTVSRVVNRHPSISDAVRERVQSAIDELGWTPNAHARSLRTGRSGLIGLSLVDLKAPTTARLAQELVIEAERQGLRVSIEPSRGQAERIMQTFASRGALFDAVVHIGPLPRDCQPPAFDPGRPIIGLCTASSLEDPVVLDSIDSDDAGAAQALTRHLQRVHHQDVVLLGREAELPDPFFGQLIDFYPDAPVLRPEARPGTRSTHIADRAAGRELAALTLEQHPWARALVCADDELAIGALSLLRERALDVPLQVALTGYGNIDDGRFSTPSLTTVDLDLPEIARRAIELISRRTGGDSSAPQRSVVPTTLIRAESTLGATHTEHRGTR